MRLYSQLAFCLPLYSHFFDNADFANGGMADWGTGVGQLEVYLDDLVSPVIVTPLNIDGLLHLYHGRAWVGFTGATGLSTWQTQVSECCWDALALFFDMVP